MRGRRCVLGVGEDNDFGVGLTGPSNMHFVQLPQCIDAVYASMQQQ